MFKKRAGRWSNSLDYKEKKDKMFQYERKKTTIAKKASSDVRKKVALDRHKPIYSSAYYCNRQLPNLTIQRIPIVTAMAPTAGSNWEAGAARPHIDELPSVCSDDSLDGKIKFIEDVLSENNWREALKNDEDKKRPAQNILDGWDSILPNLLEKYEFKSYGKNQSQTYHRPGSNNAVAPLGYQAERRMPILMCIYRASNGIRKCRRYEPDEKIKRYMRHYATLLTVRFGIKSEIQCYYDDGVIYVAVNNETDEKKLFESEINGMNVWKLGEYYLQEAIKYKKAHSQLNWTEFVREICPLFLPNKRAKTFARRLRHSIPYPALLKNAKFQVIGSRDINVKIEGLHAERKILYFLRSKKGDNFFLNPLKLGGIRRPCFICSALCFSDMDQVRPGPVWVSNAASRPKDILEMFLILNAIINKNNTTYISDNGMGNDTESSEGSTTDNIWD